MPSIVKTILDWRLDIDKEFQGWVLLFATITAIWLFCLPCYCAGLSPAPARRFAVWVSQRLPAFYLFMTIFNAAMLFLIVTWLPDWTPAEYALACAETLGATIKNLLSFATSIAMIVAFCIVVAFKDRIAQLFGLDHTMLFKCKVRDCLNCWGTARFRPVELSIWKVEDLASVDMFSANNVFVEVFLGYNEPMRTRVHNNAGSSCFLKESLQLNFDENDEEETLFIFVRNQKVMGTQELGRKEIPTDQLTDLLKDSVRKAAQVPGQRNMLLTWSTNEFTEIKLMPRGSIWLRLSPIVDHELEPGLMQDLTC